MKTNRQYRQETRCILKGHWCRSALVILIARFFEVLLPILFCIHEHEKWFEILWAFICIPVFYQDHVYYLKLVRNKLKEKGRLFKDFKDAKRIYITIFLVNLYILLWLLLLIIPGIVKSFAYTLVPYILRDNPEMNYKTALKESERLMKGKKMQLFKLYLSFLGWYLLGYLSGPGLFFVIAYFRTCEACFYEDLLKEDRAKKTQAELTAENDDLSKENHTQKPQAELTVENTLLPTTQPT